jgi:hypothetical protein
VRRLGFTPRVAFMSYSAFGNPMGERSEKVREAVAMLDARGDVDFEYEGEMPPELALDPERRADYPFMRLTGPANVLIMPAIHSASISTKLVQALGEATVVGPILLGLSKSVQISMPAESASVVEDRRRRARAPAVLQHGDDGFHGVGCRQAPSGRGGPWAIEAYLEEPLETRFIQSFKSYAASPLFTETRPRPPLRLRGPALGLPAADARSRRRLSWRLPATADRRPAGEFRRLRPDPALALAATRPRSRAWASRTSATPTSRWRRRSSSPAS